MVRVPQGLLRRTVPACQHRAVPKHLQRPRHVLPWLLPLQPALFRPGLLPHEARAAPAWQAAGARAPGHLHVRAAAQHFVARGDGRQPGGRAHHLHQLPALPAAVSQGLGCPYRGPMGVQPLLHPRVHLRIHVQHGGRLAPRRARASAAPTRITTAPRGATTSCGSPRTRAHATCRPRSATSSGSCTLATTPTSASKGPASWVSCPPTPCTAATTRHVTSLLRRTTKSATRKGRACRVRAD